MSDSQEQSRASETDQQSRNDHASVSAQQLRADQFVRRDRPMSDHLDREWYRCPECGSKYRSEHARDRCVAKHALQVMRDE